MDQTMMQKRKPKTISTTHYRKSHTEYQSMTLIIMGDWNAKEGERREGEERVTGKEARQVPGTTIENSLMYSAPRNNLALTSTTFPHKQIHKYTWTSPDGQIRNQIDLVAVNSRFKRDQSLIQSRTEALTSPVTTI